MTEKTDGQLLREFAETHSEVAFAELVGRHGRMVYNACLRTTGSAENAEDAAQACFAILARKAGSIASRADAGGWLHKVAVQTARNLRKSEVRRRVREREVGEAMRSRTSETQAGWERVSGNIDEALARLPAAQRDAVASVFLEGRTRTEVAGALGVPEGTVASRSAAGLEKLRALLTRRGTSITTVALGGMLLEHGASVALPVSFSALPATCALFAAQGAASAGSSKALLLAEGTMKTMTLLKIKIAAAILCVATVVGGGGAITASRLAAAEPAAKPAAEKAQPQKTAKRQGPLAKLPSKPAGAHLARIKALGENAWVDLGSPAPDPKWGKAPGRSWASRMPFAPDLRGAFLFGEGIHGFLKPDGHYMDDLWFYDINQHRWVCVHPGMKAKGGYKGVKLNKDGFEVTPEGHPLPIATGVHAYSMVTYDTHRKLFMNLPGAQHYCWNRIEGRVEFLTANMDKFYSESHTPRLPKGAVRNRRKNAASPWMFNTAKGHWERYRTKAIKAPRTGMGMLLYVPTVKKAFAFQKHNQPFAWYDYEKQDWIVIPSKGKSLPPWHCDFNSCYDSKRDRIYVGGGVYPVIKKGESALWMFDVKTETFTRLKPKGAPSTTCYTTSRAVMNYDSLNDVVVLILHGVTEAHGGVPGIYVYDPEKNTWETVAERPAALLPKKGRHFWNGFYDPELNVHIMHHAGDSRANGTMWAWRYKRRKK
jgi:RNA polymerase sigma factor (sigma-70 family)